MLSLFDSNPLFNPSIATDVASPQTQGGQPAHAPRPPPALDDSVQGLGDWEGEMAAIFGSNGLFAPAPDKEDGQARVKRCAKTEAGTARGGNAAAAEGRGGAAAGAGDAKWRNDASLEELRALQAEFARARGWEQHHIPRSIALALVGEAGELAECFQWKKDAQCENGLQGWSEEERTHLGEELSDVSPPTPPPLLFSEGTDLAAPHRERCLLQRRCNRLRPDTDPHRAR